MRLQRGWLWLLVGLCGCDSAKEATQDGGRRASELAEAAGARTAEAARSARDWAEGLQLGALSERAQGWLRAGAESSRSGIEALLQKGRQVAPVAVEIGRTLHAAIDSDTALEPIYQQAAAGSAEVDAAIHDMPRVEVIDGVSVGFKQLSRVDTGHHVSESGYLVMWRQGDHLVGFVLRSRRDVDLEQLVRDAPRLVALVRSVL